MKSVTKQFYDSLDKKLNKRESKKIKYATKLIKHGETIYVYHHETPIIIAKKNSIVLNVRKYFTKTTKDRLNMFLEEIGYFIYQEQYLWYLASREKLGKYPFKNGITIKSNGSIANYGHRTTEKKKNKLRKEMNKYVNDYVAELLKGNIPKPSNGDCWFCLMRNEQGKTLGEITSDKDHLLNHIKEKYYVPSLLINAINKFPVSIVTQGEISQIWNGIVMKPDVWPYDVTKGQIKSSLRRYLVLELGELIH